MKFYTITATLRETYDTNAGTASSSNNQDSLETSLSPSILVDFPMDESDFSGRYTYDLTYYQRSSAAGGNSIESTHELVAQYNHTFSERYQLGVAEQFRYYTEPSILDSTGTPYRSGAYISNTFNGQGSAQWTPLLGSTASYSNIVVRYDDAVVATQQDYVENTFTPGVSLSVLPKISANLGGTVDDITYSSGLRGYTSLTAFAGLSWQVLPSLGVAGAAGASYTQTVQSVGSTSPYVVLSLNWTLGARSSLSALYTHEVAPTDQASANGQSSDRASLNFKYDINTSLTVHVNGIITYTDVSQALINTNTLLQSYTEESYELDAGGSYHLSRHFDLEAGSIFSGVMSEINSRDYTREQVYAGIRGTY